MYLIYWLSWPSVLVGERKMSDQRNNHSHPGVGWSQSDKGTETHSAQELCDGRYTSHALWLLVGALSPPMFASCSSIPSASAKSALISIVLWAHSFPELLCQLSSVFSEHPGPPYSFPGLSSHSPSLCVDVHMCEMLPVDPPLCKARGWMWTPADHKEACRTCK